MIAACEAAGVPLHVAYYRRALPSFARIRSLIADGAIGEVRAVSLRLSQPLHDSDRDPHTRSWRVEPAISGGGRFVDLGSHMLDYLDHLFGPVKVEHAIVRNLAGAYEAEDMVMAEFGLANGAVAQGLWCFCAHERVDHTEIIGSRGSVAFAHFADTPVRLRTPAGEEVLEMPWPRHVQQPLLQMVVDALRGRGECPSTGHSAARTNAVIDAVLAHRVDAPSGLPIASA
jgi:predicted dehydrogenase